MTVLLLVLLLLLIAINSFFVAAEFAVVRSRRARLEQMRDDGVRGATRALAQLDRVDEFVATSQVGITLASLGIGFLGGARPCRAAGPDLRLRQPRGGARAGDRARLHHRHLPARDPR